MQLLWRSCQAAPNVGLSESDCPLAPTLSNLGVMRSNGMRADGRMVPVTCRVAGKLVLVFEEAAALAFQTSLMRADAERDPQLMEVLEIAHEVLAEPPVPSTLAKQIGADLYRHYGRKERILPGVTFHEHLESMLLERGHFKRCVLLGEEHVCAQLLPEAMTPDDRELFPLPTYLPASVMPRLPAIQGMSVMVDATVHSRLDQSARHPYALQVSRIFRTVRAGELTSSGSR